MPSAARSRRIFRACFSSTAWSVERGDGALRVPLPPSPVIASGPACARRYGFDIDHPAQWEVEALEPEELQCLVLAAVDPYIDCEVLAEQLVREEQQRRALSDFLGGWGAAGGASSKR